MLCLDFKRFLQKLDFTLEFPIRSVELEISLPLLINDEKLKLISFLVSIWSHVFTE